MILQKLVEPSSLISSGQVLTWVIGAFAFLFSTGTTLLIVTLRGNTRELRGLRIDLNSETIKRKSIAEACDKKHQWLDGEVKKQGNILTNHNARITKVETKLKIK
jgi:hypothetical protein